MKLSNVILTGFLMLPAIVGAQEKSTAESKSAALGLSAGDQISVHMYDFPELGLGVLVHVDTDGMVRLPYVGSLQAVGFSQAALQREIVESLQAKGIVKQPNVTVDLVAGQNLGVDVVGQVIAPRTVPLFAPAHLSYVLAQVGGLGGLAARKVTVLHRGDQGPVSVDYDPDAPTAAAMNTMVYPGDTVTVSNRGVYFIAGEVVHPGIYPMGGGISIGQITQTNGEGMVKHITLLGALAQAGGITAIAARSHLHILRTVDGKRVDIEVNQVKLSEGKVADPLLQADDIIYLPPSYWRQQTNNLFATAVSGITAASYVRTANY